MSILSPSVLDLTRKYAAIWRALPPGIPDDATLFSDAEQSETEGRIDTLLKEVEHCASPAAARRTVKRFVDDAENSETGSLRTYSDDFSEASRLFVEQAHEFDRGICDDDIQQALRNLWVFNALQLMFAGTVSCRPGAFAYSLLYPYTDNFFDNPETRPSVKQAFGAWISERLSGKIPDPGIGVSGRVHALIRMIEEEFPRSMYPHVYEGLHAIHDAQMQALVNPGDATDGTMEEVSVRKGGSSVLADALLVRGWLHPHEIEFSFRFGVLLQFIDDLQDGSVDAGKNFVTLFSAGRARTAAHDPVCRLFRFVFETFAPGHMPDSGAAQQIMGLMRRSCLALICDAVHRQAERFDGGFVKSIAPLCPVHPRYLATLHGRLPALRRIFPGGIRSILVATI